MPIGAHISFVYILLVHISSVTPSLFSLFFFRTLSSNIHLYLADPFYPLVAVPLALHIIFQIRIIIFKKVITFDLYNNL